MKLELFALVLVLAPRAALAQCADFDAGFAYPGINGRATTALEADLGNARKLYIGGWFDSAGDARAHNVASFDGARFEALGAGFSRGVETLAVFDAGNGSELYAGGSFTSSGGVATRCIARWNGASWLPAGTFTGGGTTTIYELDVLDTGNGPELFALGNFSAVDGVQANGLARFDGTAWFGVPTTGFSTFGLPPPVFGSVVRFDAGATPRWVFKAGNGAANRIYTWNGATFSYLTMVTGSNGEEVELQVFDDGHGSQLYLGGAFDAVSGYVPHTLEGLVRWNGATWSTLPGWSGQHVTELAVHDFGGGAALYLHATGPTFARWDGAQLATLAPATNGGVLVDFDDGSGSKLWNFSSPPTPSQSYAVNVERFDGAAWSPLAIAGFGLTWLQATPSVQAFADFDGSLYVGGQFAAAGNVAADMLARFDGSGWSSVAGTEGFAAVNALQAFDDGAGNQLYVGGTFAGPSGTSSAGIAAWDGSTWHSLAGGLHKGAYVGIAHACAVFDDGHGPALFVGGEFDVAGATPALDIARWKNGAWSNLGGGVNGRVLALQVYDDGNGPALYAGGEFVVVDGQSDMNNVARWDGSAWRPLGLGLDFHVRALTVLDEGGGPVLVAGGLFANAGGQPAPFVAQWNGASWSALPGGPTDPVLALASYDDGSGPALIVGGTFVQFENGATARSVAKWQGSTWTELGGGLNASFAAFSSRCTALHVFADGLAPQGSLYVGGIFDEAGSVAATTLARYRDRCACSGTTYCTSGTTSSGCVPSIAGIGRASATATSGFEIRVTGVEGARSGHVFYGVSGPHAAPWGSSSHFLCVKAPSQRTGTQSTGGNAGQCDGTLSLDWNQYVATHPGSLGAPFSAGVEVWAQAYFRDPPGPKTTALSNGLRFAVCP